MSAEPKVPRTRRALAVIGACVVVAGTLAVTVAAFTLSYDAIRSVGIAANTRPTWAWMLPVSIDGAMGVATVAVLLLKQLGRSTWYPWVVVAVGVLVSGGCNALHAGGRDGRVDLADDWARAVGVIPPIMLALSVHLLAVLVKELSGSERAEPGRSLPGTDDAEQSLAPTATPATNSMLPGTPEQTEQTEQTRTTTVPDRGLNEPSAPACNGQAARTEQMPTVATTQDRPRQATRTEQTIDLGKQNRRLAKRTEGQGPGQDSGQRTKRSRNNDEELIALVLTDAAEKVADGSLGRYDVEKLTGASMRQANRVLDAVRSRTEQTEQTEQNGVFDGLADAEGPEPSTGATPPVQHRTETAAEPAESERPSQIAESSLPGLQLMTDLDGQGEADESALQVSITVGTGVGGSG
ncbi:DUF2637 domain-containing protein [Dactylosporangium siamense]|uniref:DUF2637 domain-containing protein n=1 Tax=Dactylosporangium siamense TaxID=685454 RepID=A0A919UIP4_9ACTN|nr:DUF2637 domain-containing protein [Dactylosporangium siamense]GIG52900.1 hypothetical protein Dsi01nite_109410 [Dactylosporangium siamense]